MRLRVAIIVIVVLVLFGLTVVAHQRATAEHVRVALFQAGAAETAPPSGATAGGERPANATPLAAGLPAGAVVAVPPGATESRATPPFGAAGSVGVIAAPGGFAQSAPAAFGAGPAAPPPVTVQVAPGNLYAPSGPMLYPGAPPADDPEMNELTGQDQQLEQEVQSLARQLAGTDDDKTKADLKEKLAATLERQFDAQQKLRQREISRIEARVQKLRELVQKRTESRRKIIDNRFDQLLNDAEGLGWSSGTTPRSQYVPHAFPGMLGPPRLGTPPALAPRAATSAPRQN
jgi:hypothetical protein